MKALIIKDLPATNELDASAMSAVRGGSYSGGYMFPGAVFSLSREDFKFDATQILSQSQNTEVNNGNNVAFASGITSNVTPTQTGSNNINFV